eukprot:TRINITY_DN75142_c0_g1_i1.p1 TRINITY_DN75142_c0_g1~~TRINITY_DN75142_c0_g1_i1.p1  ORF type:complete len:385 (-),score=27.99 TRINITY_DN75142_c0_g1_i1:13-1167(-)
MPQRKTSLWLRWSGAVSLLVRQPRAIDSTDIEIAGAGLTKTLPALGCRLPGQSRPSHGMARISREFSEIAVLVQQWRDLRDALHRIKTAGHGMGSGQSHSAEEGFEFLASVNAPSWLLDAYVRLVTGNVSGGPYGMRSARRFQQRMLSYIENTFQLTAQMRALEPRIEEAMNLRRTTVDIVNVTGVFVPLTRYSGRSCAAPEGMWQKDIRDITTRKMQKVVAMLGVESFHSVLYLGAGCGGPLDVLTATGAHVVGQELLEANLAFLEASHPELPICGGESGHFLSGLPKGAFDLVIANSLLVDQAAFRRCNLVREAVRVARVGVYFGWNDFNISNWHSCGFREDFLAVPEGELFASEGVEYAADTHSFIYPRTVAAHTYRSHVD